MTKPYKCRVEYLESSGTQYIDTGYKPNSNTKVEAKFKMNETPNNFVWLFHARNQTVAGDGYGCGCNGSGYITSDFNNRVSSSTVKLTSGTIYNIVKDKNICKVNDITLTNTNSTFTINYSLLIFALNDHNSVNAAIPKANCYYFRIYDNDVLVRDFIPVLDNNGRPAMYDKVSGQLFYNQGTGEFSYGRKIIPVEYLESTGTQYIDTGINVSNSLKWQLDASYETPTGSTGYLHGVSRVEGSNQQRLMMGVNSANYYSMSFVENNTTTIPNDNNRHLFEIDTLNKTYSIDGEQKGTFASNFTLTTLSIYLFGRHINSDVDSKVLGKVYGSKIYNNNTLVSDYIPCIDENNVPFMFDLVNCKIYENAGTGQFKVGANVEKSGNKNFLRKKLDMFLATLKKERPYYCEVEYLASTNQQNNSTSTTSAAWIDTGIIPDDTTKMECRMAFTTLISGISDEALCGSSGSTGNFRFAWGFASLSPYTNFYAGLGGQNLTTSITRDTNVHTFKIDAINKTWAIDNTSGSFTSSGSLSGTSSIFLFARHIPYYGDNVANKPANANIYYCKIWKGGSLVRDFIPVLDWNMTPCMYDRVTEQLFYNQGTGSFIAGREIHPVDYLESTGTQYIDTGVKLTNNHSVEVDYQLTSASQNRKGIFGGLVTNGPRFGALLSPSNNYLEFGYGSTNVWYQPGLPDTQRHIMKQQKNLLYFDGVLTYTFNTATFTQDFTAPLGNFTYTNYNPASAKYYSSKWWDGDVLVRDYIPAIDENGVGFMFDKVTHTIYDNAGTGAFSYSAREVEYLESTGTQYIDTGYVPTTKNNFVIDFSLNALNSNCCPFGCATGSLYTEVFLVTAPNASTISQFVAINNNTVYNRPSFPWATNVNYHTELTQTNLIINGNVVDTLTVGSGTASQSIYLFARNNSGTVDFKGNMKIRSFKAYDNGVLVRDFIPCYKDGVLGMWDKVNSVFYPNAGTGNFTTGKIIEPEYES